jgi:hypothetical protein
MSKTLTATADWSEPRLTLTRELLCVTRIPEEEDG